MGLFSTTHHYHDTKTVSVPYEKSVTVNEHRAPTDKSVELLNEFTDRAKDNIIYTAKISDNHLEAIAIYYRDELIADRVHFSVKFKLNGTEYLVSDYVDGFLWKRELASKYMGFGHEGIYRMVHEKFSNIIAYELMKASPDFMGKINEQLNF